VVDRELRAVIFDLDGVITDTAEFHYRAWQRLADEEGIPFDRDANEALRGIPRRESLLLILGDREVEEDVLLDMMERKNRYYVASLDDVTPADTLPGAVELVADAKRRGLEVAIGSSSKNARHVLDRLQMTDVFDAIADGDSVERAKPEPDLFLAAADMLGVPAESCVVVEDASSGIDAALAAGMVAVGVGPAERVGHAHHRFDTVADIDLDAVLGAAERGVAG
jgi:beta-phosphoglucomutase